MRRNETDDTPADITRSEEIAAGVVDFCRQCHRHKPLSDFIGRRGSFVVMCVSCRARYANWDAKTASQKRAARSPQEHTGTGYRASFVLQSKNRKTGPIPVTMTDMRSCPSTCPHRDRGCYAGYGKNAHHWREVGRRGVSWEELCEHVAALPPGTLWRHNEAGDLPGVGQRVDVSALRRLVTANRGRRGFTFTHKPLRTRSEVLAVRRANARGFTVNLSADSLAAADALTARRIGPVAVILPAAAPVKLRTPGGLPVITCLAETRGLTCASCGLCAVATRKSIVGFRAHGQGARLVELRTRRP